MAHRYHDIAFTGTVKAFQGERGSRDAYARAEGGEVVADRLGPAEAAFIAARDSLYLASVSETGWPYIQHRGGPAGFVRVLDERTLGFADFAGNRQYVTAGNVAGDARVSLFFMDYANRRRLKMFGRAAFLSAEQVKDAGLAEALALPGYRAKVTGATLIRVEAVDWNCPQHITPRFTEAEIAEATAPLRARIAELEAAKG